MPEVKTKTAPRRDIQFSDLGSILNDLERLEAADKTGSLVQNGNWTLGQISHHLADLIEQSLDGFRFKAPALIRILFTLLRPVLFKRPIPAGIALRGKSRVLIPDSGISSEQGLGQLRAQIKRLQDGAQMTHPSPIFGRLDQDQWMGLHLRHAALHLSFLDPGQA